MRLRFAILSEYALAHPDGRIYITGGGIDSLAFPRLPWTYPHLALAVGVAFERIEGAGQHLIEVRADSPSGERMLTPLRIPVRLRPAVEGSSLTANFQFVWNMRDVNFTESGRHIYRVLGDDDECAALPLDVVLAATGKAVGMDAVTNWDVDLQSGYEAFLAGDLASAMKIFAELVRRFPTLAAAHNNYGFVLLAQGEAAKAIDAFERAREYGYRNEELLEVNIGCSEYLLLRPDNALLRFMVCLRERTLKTGAVLFAIGAQPPRPVQLTCPGDYAALVAANAGWAALAVERRDLAKELATTASSMLGSQTEGVAQSRSSAIKDSIEMLRQRLGSS